MNDDEHDCHDNVLIPGPELPSGDRICLAHMNGHQSHIGVMRGFKSGESIPDDARIISPIEGTPLYHIGESIAEMKSGSKDSVDVNSRTGPSRVTTPAYRKGYDKIFKSHHLN